MLCFVIYDTHFKSARAPKAFQICRQYSSLGGGHSPEFKGDITVGESKNIVIMKKRFKLIQDIFRFQLHFLYLCLVFGNPQQFAHIICANILCVLPAVLFLDSRRDRTAELGLVENKYLICRKSTYKPPITKF